MALQPRDQLQGGRGKLDFGSRVSSPQRDYVLTRINDIVDRWTSLEALMDHSKWDFSINMRNKISELTTLFEFKMSKVFVGFS
jgi:hypothetical protein